MLGRRECCSPFSLALQALAFDAGVLDRISNGTALSPVYRGEGAEVSQALLTWAREVVAALPEGNSLSRSVMRQLRASEVVMLFLAAVGA